MERALNLDLLQALGEGGMFPSAEELQRRLAEAEIALRATQRGRGQQGPRSRVEGRDQLMLYKRAQCRTRQNAPDQ